MAQYGLISKQEAAICCWIISQPHLTPPKLERPNKKSFDKIFSDLSKKYKLQLIPFLLEGVAQKPEFNLSDGMHPNDQGTIIIGNTLKKAILENL